MLAQKVHFTNAPALVHKPEPLAFGIKLKPGIVRGDRFGAGRKVATHLRFLEGANRTSRCAESFRQRIDGKFTQELMDRSDQPAHIAGQIHRRTMERESLPPS